MITSSYKEAVLHLKKFSKYAFIEKQRLVNGSWVYCEEFGSHFADNIKE